MPRLYFFTISSIGKCFIGIIYINKYTTDWEETMKNDKTLRLYVLIREDLGMSEGKKMSQAGHAYLGAFINANAELQSAYHSEFPIHPGTKVCLTAKNLPALLKAKEQAEAAGIPAYLVTDSGCENFFGGEPTITALGLGPACKDQIKQITKRFQLM